MEKSMGKDNKVKVIFFLGALGGGGAERVASNLMKYLDRNRFDISLVLCEDEVAYSIPNDVKKYVLLRNKKKRVFNHFIKILKLYRILIKEKPDVILSFMEYPNIINVLFKYIIPFRNIKHLISVRIVESRFYPRKYWRFLKFFYSKADIIICVSNDVVKDLIENFNIQKNKMIVIYNPVCLKDIEALKNEEIYEIWFKNNNPKIISVGRLTEQKGYDYLLRAFKIVMEKGITADLIILGEGDKKTIENLAKDLKVEEHVILPGFQRNPFKFISKSDIFVLSSLYEGFPNALIEAMACNVPVIATRCPSGPEEIITDGVNGLLVPVKDEKALAEAIIDLLKNKTKAEKLAKAGRKRVEDFDINTIVKKYECVFLQNKF